MTDPSALDENMDAGRFDGAVQDGAVARQPGTNGSGAGLMNGAAGTVPAEGAAIGPTIADLALLRERAAEAARLLRLLANEKRLLVLCHLVAAGEMNVGDLAQVVGLSQSALSQHLAKLREDGLVATRREAQTIHYRLADAKAARVLEVLHDLYCRPAS